MYLFLDTSTLEHINILFATKEKILLSRHIPQSRGKRIDVLFELSQAFKKLTKTPDSLMGFYVVIGPGAFSHLRTGISIANTFFFVKKTRIIGIATDEFPHTIEDVFRIVTKKKSSISSDFLMPAYGKEPNITIKKK